MWRVQGGQEDTDCCSLIGRQVTRPRPQDEVRVMTRPWVRKVGGEAAGSCPLMGEGRQIEGCGDGRMGHQGQEARPRLVCL